MTNILPKDSLNAVQSFYRSRFIFVGSLIFIICGVIALLALFPTYAIVTAESGTAESGTAEETSEPSASFEVGGDREAVVRAQTLVREFYPIASSTTSVLELLDKVLSLRPTSVLVQNITMKRGEDGTIVISGSIGSRDDITAYRMALEESGLFKSVSVPLGILAGAANDRFTMTITGSF